MVLLDKLSRERLVVASASAFSSDVTLPTVEALDTALGLNDVEVDPALAEWKVAVGL